MSNITCTHKMLHTNIRILFLKFNTLKNINIITLKKRRTRILKFCKGLAEILEVNE